MDTSKDLKSLDMESEDDFLSEDEEGSIPKHETGKMDLVLKEVTKIVNHKNQEYRLVLCPQAPVVGNLKRKASFFPRLSVSHLTTTEIACVIYSIDDEKSFSFAEDLLMQMEDLKVNPATLLVANAPKSLLGHRRIHTERGSKCADKYGCIGFFEFNPFDITEADRVLEPLMQHVHEFYSTIHDGSPSSSGTSGTCDASKNQTALSSSVPETHQRNRNVGNEPNGTCCNIS